MTEVAQPFGAHLNGNVDVIMENLTGSNLRFSSGLILPPPEIKGVCSNQVYDSQLADKTLAVIDRTALYVARSANPPLFEERVREGQRSDPKFSFLNPHDPYHAYYRHRMDKVAKGEIDDDTVQKDKQGDKEERQEPVDVGVEPPVAEFILNLPNITSIDL